jgi:hypothetical protein
MVTPRSTIGGDRESPRCASAGDVSRRESAPKRARKIRAVCFTGLSESSCVTGNVRATLRVAFAGRQLGRGEVHLYGNRKGSKPSSAERLSKGRLEPPQRLPCCHSPLQFFLRFSPRPSRGPPPPFAIALRPAPRQPPQSEPRRPCRSMAATRRAYGEGRRGIPRSGSSSRG